VAEDHSNSHRLLDYSQEGGNRHSTQWPVEARLVVLQQEGTRLQGSELDSAEDVAFGLRWDVLDLVSLP